MRVALALALAWGGTLGLAWTAAAEAAVPERPNLILITLDTTRADHLGCYGYEKGTSPHLDRLARDARVYTRAYSTSSWTLPSHASLFTGRFPASHGARLDPTGSLLLAQGIVGEGEVHELRARGLSPGERTLAQILSDAGYTTGAVVGGPWMKRVFTLDRGFEHYDDAQITDVGGRLAEQISAAALAWLETHRSGPFFLFLNYYDPHGPYEDPAGLIRNFLPPHTPVWPPPRPMTDVYASAAYDGEIQYMDRHLGELLERLRAWGLYDPSWIVVTADHGELLGEHGDFGHGHTLWEPEIRIPLLVKRPGSADAGRSDQRIQLTGVFHLLLEGLGLAAPMSDATTPVFAEVRPQSTRRLPGSWRAWIEGDHKLLRHARGERRLFDLTRDPAESRDLAAEQPERTQAMDEALARFVASLPPPEAAGPGGSVDDETRRALEALGYVE